MKVILNPEAHIRHLQNMLDRRDLLLDVANKQLTGDREAHRIEVEVLQKQIAKDQQEIMSLREQLGEMEADLQQARGYE